MVSLTISGGQSYSWSPSNLFLNPTSNSTSVLITKPTLLYAETLDENNCKSVDSLFIEWKPAPVYTANAINETVCLGKGHEIIASGGDRYLWMPSNLLQNATSQNTIANILVDTVISVQIWNEECNDSTMLQVGLKLWPKPQIGVTKSGDIDCNVPSVQLSATGGETYKWEPSLGISNATISNPIASPVETTVYQVKVADRFNCEYTDTIRINVLKTGDLSLYQLPDAFTPNGDGLNDCFGISKWGSGIKLEDFKIYNRWGSIVFSGKNGAICWDGLISGKQAPSGSYIYKLRATSLCGSINLSGVVVLIL
jgi:gliding motility-associated-like protein